MQRNCFSGSFPQASLAMGGERMNYNGDMEDALESDLFIRNVYKARRFPDAGICAPMEVPQPKEAGSRPNVGDRISLPELGRAPMALRLCFPRVCACVQSGLTIVWPSERNRFVGHFCIHFGATSNGCNLACISIF